jgi:hypothetical protein
MKSALSLIAFSQRSDLEGTILLLEAALEALDRQGCALPGAFVEHALSALRGETQALGDGFGNLPLHE